MDTIVFSDVVNRLLYATLTSTAGFTAEVGDRIFRGLGYPPGTALPACLFYMEQSEYDAGQLAGAEHVNGAQMRFVVRLDDVGTSNARILAAFRAQELALNGLVTTNDDGVQVTFTALGEVPMSGGYVEGDTVYQRQGTIYSVDVTRG